MRAIDLLNDARVHAEGAITFAPLLRRCPTAADRKGLILAAHDYGALSRGETRLLIQAFQLETA